MFSASWEYVDAILSAHFFGGALLPDSAHAGSASIASGWFVGSILV